MVKLYQPAKLHLMFTAKFSYTLNALQLGQTILALKSEATSKVQEQLTQVVPVKSDTTLVGEVAQALAYRAGIKNPLIIRAYNSVITLRGQVDTEADLDLAEGAALSVPGVKAVINGQTVKASAKIGPTRSENQAPTGVLHTPSTPSTVPGWTLPSGELAILDGAEVFARDGKVGRAIGIGFKGLQMEAQVLIVEKAGFMFKSRRYLLFKYIEGSYFVGNPAIFLKINRSKFNELTQGPGIVQSRTSLQDVTQIELSTFGNKTPIHFLGQKLGWLGGILLKRQKPSDPASYNLSHYILKTGRNSKRLLLPFEAVEKRSGKKTNTLHLLPNRGELLMHPEQFNGYSEPKLVVDRVLEKLAWSTQMQHWGGRLRVGYQKGEVSLEGAMTNRAKFQHLIEIVESVPGVRRVHNLIKVKT